MKYVSWLVNVHVLSPRWSTAMEKVKRGVWVNGPWALKTEHGGLDRGVVKKLENGPRMASTWHNDEQDHARR